MDSAYAEPVIVRPDGQSVRLTRIPLSGPQSRAVYDEHWLQDLLYRHPAALPVAEIDDTFDHLIPLCREMTLPGAGDADVVYVTPTGRPVIVEAKLWRNPEARRKVVSQVLDYARELTRFSFDDLDKAVRAARQRVDREVPPRTLMEIIASSGRNINEVQFRDALARNLRRGEMLLLVVGDGIREGAGAITGFLEANASLHFTFGLVEVAIYAMPDGGHLLQPRVLAQTQVVRRVVVELADSRMVAREQDPTEEEAQEEEASEEVVQSRKRYQGFWIKFLDELHIEDGEQKVGAPSVSTNQYFMMPTGSTAWVSAFLAQSSGSAGVYLTFSKGPVGDRLYAALEEDRVAIDEELGLPGVQWMSSGGKHKIRSTLGGYSGQLIEDHGPAIRAALAERVARFVKVFRPRLQKLVDRETGG